MTEKKTIKKYRKDKIKMLKQFNITLSDEQLNRLHNLNTEISIDNFCRPIILNKLDDGR